jgi:cytoskeletal protein RodZ
MRRQLTSPGFIGIEVVLALVVAVLIGVAAFGVYSAQHQNTAEATSPDQSTQVGTVPAAPAKISTTADLTAAEHTLDSVNVDDTEAAQLDQDLAAF